MSDPVRLLDQPAGESADDFELGLLASATTDVAPDRAVGRTLVALGVGTAIGAGAASASATATAASAAAAGSVLGPSAAATVTAAGSMLTLKWIVFGALAGFVTAGGVFAAQGALAPAPVAPAASPASALPAKAGAPLATSGATRTVPELDTLAAPADPAVPSPSAASAAPPGESASREAMRATNSAGERPADGSQPERPSNGTATASPAGAASAPELMAEVAALDRVRAALASHQPSVALAELDRYAHDFPRGGLAPEATVLRIDALLQSGDRASAALLAKPFLEGTSPHANRVRAMFEQSSPPATNR